MKKRIVTLISFLILISVLLMGASKLVMRKDSLNEYRGFYENSKDIDVLFFGASVVHYAVSPMQLWNEYGITSYNMGNDSEKLTMSYYDMLQALDYANPKVIVMDLTAMGWAGNKRSNMLTDHFFIDAVPLSNNKIKEIRELFNKDEYLEYIFPFTLYHTRWNELSESDFKFNEHNSMYGATFMSGSMDTPVPTPDMYEESRFGPVEEESVAIDSIISLCENRGIELIFTYLPGGMRGGDQKLREYCAKYLEDKGVTFIDMNINNDYIDWHRDFMDQGHVNFFGAQKVTHELGKIIKSNCDVPDHRNDAILSDKWNADYMDYELFVDEYMGVYKEEYENF